MNTMLSNPYSFLIDNFWWVIIILILITCIFFDFGFFKTKKKHNPRKILLRQYRKTKDIDINDDTTITFLSIKNNNKWLSYAREKMNNKEYMHHKILNNIIQCIEKFENGDNYYTETVKVSGIANYIDNRYCDVFAEAIINDNMVVSLRDAVKDITYHDNISKKSYTIFGDPIFYEADEAHIRYKEPAKLIVHKANNI